MRRIASSPLRLYRLIGSGGPHGGLKVCSVAMSPAFLPAGVLASRHFIGYPVPYVWFPHRPHI